MISRRLLLILAILLFITIVAVQVSAHNLNFKDDVARVGDSTQSDFSIDYDNRYIYGCGVKAYSLNNSTGEINEIASRDANTTGDGGHAVWYNMGPVRSSYNKSNLIVSWKMSLATGTSYKLCPLEVWYFNGTDFILNDTWGFNFSQYDSYYVFSIYSDSNYIYIARTETLDVFANENYGISAFTFIDNKLEIVANRTGDGVSLVSIYGDGTYIYALYGASKTMKAYTFDGTSFSLVGTKSDNDISAESYIYCANGYIYVANNGGLKIYTFDGSDFSLITSRKDYSTCYGVSVKDNFVYVAEASHLIEYIFDGTSLSLVNVTTMNTTNNRGVQYIDNNFVVTSKHARAKVSYHLEETTCKDDATTNIEETTATISGYLLWDGGPNSTCGLWLNNSSTVDNNNFLQNLTCDGTYNSLDTFSSGVSNLTSGTYYYVKSWASNYLNTTNATTNLSYFLTKPNAPTNLHVVSANATNITLQWTNTTTYVDNQSTMIRYKAGSYPTSTTDGTLGYNGTAEEAVIEGLGIDTTYYFKAWTYINASGSPFYWWYSDDYSSSSGDTSGGTYNITVRYENNLSLVSATHSKFLNSKCWAETIEGISLNYSDTFTTNPLQLSTLMTVDIFFFDWNNQSMIRSVIPEAGERNITIYICDEPLYNGSIDLNDSQVFYTFDFVNDYTPNSIFLVSPESKLYLYLYNGTTKYFIHQDFFSAEDTVRVALEYGKRYWIGLECDALYLPFLQYVDTGSETTVIEVNILYQMNQTFVITDFAIMNLSWDPSGNGMYVNYFDSVTGTNSGTMRIERFYGLNGTKVFEQDYIFETSLTSFHYTTAMGCNNTADYFVTIEVNHELLIFNGTLQGLLPYIAMGNETKIGWLEGVLEAVLGESPIPSVRWIDLMSMVLVFMFLVTFGQINGNVALMASGLILIFLEVGLGAFTAAASALAISVGIAMFLFGIIFMYGEGNR